MRTDMEDTVRHLSGSEEDGELSTSSKMTTVSEAREKMADTKKASSKTSSRRSKRKNDLEEMEQRWEKRFSHIDERFDKFFHLYSSNNQNKDTVTSGEQRPCSSGETQSGSIGAHNSVEHSATVSFPRSLCREENDHSDVVSLTPGHEERHDIGLLSDNDSNSVSVRSESGDKPQKPSSRFSQYVKGTQSDISDENNNDHLQNLFGEDAKTKSESSSVGLVLDKSQIDILSGSWRCKNPEKISAYCEEYKNSFPVHDKSLEHLEVPSLDSMVPDLLTKKHGSKAYSSGKKSNLHTPCMKGVEKLAYQGQIASRMGIITTAYTQQALGTLLQTLSSDNVNIDKCVQLTRDIFAMSTKSLDQISRAGAFHHLIRRKVTLEDTGLGSIKELKNSLVSLPLSNSGVFGDELEQTLKDRVDKNEQLKKLLPELHVTPKTFLGKRKSGNTSNDFPKKHKSEATGSSNSSYNKIGFTKTIPKSSTVTKEKEDKNAGASNFRGFNSNYKKGPQKK